MCGRQGNEGMYVWSEERHTIVCTVRFRTPPPISPHGGRPQREAALLAQVQAIKLAVRAGVNKEAKNNELNFPPNFERLVLGCIETKFCK